MKRRALRWAAAVGMAAILAGPAPAFTAEKESPEFGTWQYWEAVEAGTLPSPLGSGEVREAVSGGKEKGPVVELGGIPFRVGLDTP